MDESFLSAVLSFSANSQLGSPVCGAQSPVLWKDTARGAACPLHLGPLRMTPGESGECLSVASRGPSTKGRLLENQTFLSLNPFLVQTRTIPVSPGLQQHTGPVSLGTHGWLRSQSPREEWGAEKWFRGAK